MLDADRKLDNTGKPKGNKLAPTERALLLREREALTQQKEAMQEQKANARVEAIQHHTSQVGGEILSATLPEFAKVHDSLRRIEGLLPYSKPQRSDVHAVIGRRVDVQGTTYVIDSAVDVKDPENPGRPKKEYLLLSIASVNRYKQHKAEAAQAHESSGKKVDISEKYEGHFYVSAPRFKELTASAFLRGKAIMVSVDQPTVPAGWVGTLIKRKTQKKLWTCALAHREFEIRADVAESDLTTNIPESEQPDNAYSPTFLIGKVVRFMKGSNVKVKDVGESHSTGKKYLLDGVEGLVLSANSTKAVVRLPDGAEIECDLGEGLQVLDKTEPTHRRLRLAPSRGRPSSSRKRSSAAPVASNTPPTKKSSTARSDQQVKEEAGALQDRADGKDGELDRKDLFDGEDRADGEQGKLDPADCAEEKENDGKLDRKDRSDGEDRADREDGKLDQEDPAEGWGSDALLFLYENYGLVQRMNTII